MNRQIDIHPQDHRYFTCDGETAFIPVGLNLCFCRNTENMPEQQVLEQYQKWMTNFAANGGNFIRIWLGVPFFDVMPDQVGVYSRKNCSHIRFIVKLAEELNIRIKFTLEHFRTVHHAQVAESYAGAAIFDKPIYAPMAENIHQYLASPQCRQAYLDKARFLAEQGFGDSPATAVWELWNEINNLGTVPEIAEWSDYMIGELQKIFPRQLIVQNLGSFSASDAYQLYDYLGSMKNNPFLQIHRYLDPGAELDICQAPMDCLAADSIRELQHRNPRIPVLLAECGAVEANHNCYSHLYAEDSEGTMLHDILFAPFFTGSAGCGQAWHWDHIYISRHHLWHHFRWFCNAVEGIDPAVENFQPFHTETHRLRIYGLRGKSTTLLWCRDKQSSWLNELEKKIPAEIISGESIPVDADSPCECYLPWENLRTVSRPAENLLRLPDFRRSMVIRQKRS